MDVKHVVDRIIHDLRGRRGLGQEWEKIESDIQDEIRKVWEDIITDELRSLS